MGLKDSVLAERRRTGGHCSFVSVYASLNKKDAGELREVLAMSTDEANNSMIVRALNSMGHKMSASTVQRHRNGECTCGHL